MKRKPVLKRVEKSLKGEDEYIEDLSDLIPLYNEYEDDD
jgi:hypothetical protein